MKSELSHQESKNPEDAREFESILNEFYLKAKGQLERLTGIDNLTSIEAARLRQYVREAMIANDALVKKYSSDKDTPHYTVSYDIYNDPSVPSEHAQMIMDNRVHLHNEAVAQFLWWLYGLKMDDDIVPEQALYISDEQERRLYEYKTPHPRKGEIWSNERFSNPDFEAHIKRLRKVPGHPFRYYSGASSLLKERVKFLREQAQNS